MGPFHIVIMSNNKELFNKIIGKLLSNVDIEKSMLGYITHAIKFEVQDMAYELVKKDKIINTDLIDELYI